MPRILALLRGRGLHATFFVPGYTAERHPERVRGDPRGGPRDRPPRLHPPAQRQGRRPTQQREEIEQGFAALEAAGAPRPRGYRSPAWELTPETFALLVEHGFAYDSSAMGDDRPYVEEWDGLRMLELPVHWSLDDWPRFGWSIDLGGNVGAVAELHDSWLAEYEPARAERPPRLLHHAPGGDRPRLPLRAARRAWSIASSADGDTWIAPLDDVAAHAAPVLGVRVA